MSQALQRFDTPEPRSGRAASADGRAAGLKQIVLVEDHADHAELIAETLESAFPGVPVLRPERGDVVSEQPGALLLSLDSSLARVRVLLAGPAQRLPLILLTGASDRWTLQDLPAPNHPVARLDKRDGHRFLQRLPEAVAESVQQAARALPRTSEAPGVAVPAAGAPRAAHEAAGETPPDQRATEAATGLLLSALERVLANITPIAGLVRSRFPGDAAAHRYATSLEDELARARAVARRLSAVAGPERAPLLRRMNLAQLVGLRAAAWTMLVPPGVEIQVTNDERTPDIEIVPDVVGTVLDDLLQAVAQEAPVPARLRVQVKGAALDGGLAAEPAGLKRGRYARLTIELERTALRHAAAARVTGRKLERALAVVKAHGGYLELQHEHGAPAPCCADVFLPAAAPRPAPGPDSRARTVLLVDDDAAVRQVTLEMLKTIGIEPTAASCGEDALELYRAGCRYDLVLLDLSMGAGMSGRTAYAELKQIDPEAAVLLVSGSVTAPTLRALLERGLLGFLPKPFGMRQLVSAVQAALGS